MPKSPLTPQQKKKLSYSRDHYVRGGESMHAWRKSKRVKKRKAVHSARRRANAAIKKLDLDDTPGEAAGRRLTTVKQKKIYQWGVRTLGQHVKRARKRREQT